MSNISAGLKHARQARGISLRDEGATKISVGALEGARRHDYGRLPGGVSAAPSSVPTPAKSAPLNPEGPVHEFLVDFARWERESESQAKRPEK